MQIPRNIPRIKLPKLSVKLIAKPLFAVAGLSVLARAKIVCGLIVNAFSPIQKLYSTLSNFSGAGAAANIKNTLNSVKKQITDQVNGVVGAAIANVTGAVKAVSKLAQNVVDAFKNSGETLKKQKESVKNIIKDEIDCVKSSLKDTSTASTVQSTINRQATKQVESLTNNETKQLSEDPIKQQEFVNKVTEKVIDTSSTRLASAFSSSTTNQIVAVNTLANLGRTI